MFCGTGPVELSVGDRVLVGGCRQRSMFLIMSGLLPPPENTTGGQILGVVATRVMP